MGVKWMITTTLIDVFIFYFSWKDDQFIYWYTFQCILATHMYLKNLLEHLYLRYRKPSFANQAVSCVFKHNFCQI